MRRWFSAESFFRRHPGLLVIAGALSIAGSVAILQLSGTGRDDADPAAVLDEPATPEEPDSPVDESRYSKPETWRIPETEPRDRSGRPLLELVGVYTGAGRNATALIREKDGPTFTYRLGDKLAGDRELIEVHDTYVLLRNPDYIERLRLGNRSAAPQYTSEELEAWARQLVDPPPGSDEPPGEER